MVLPDVKNEPMFDRKVDELTGFNTESIICIPLQTHGRILGVFEIVNVKNISDFESRYLPILTILADYAAIAIENSQYYDRIYQMTRTDEYTGLYNARYLHQILDEMILEASYDRPFAVVFVDVDNFKNVVDTAGHLLGSQILKEVGQTISSCLFEQDILIKYGGDEYIIIFPDRDRQEVTALSEKILQTIRETTYLASETHPVNITASFGIAMYPEDARTKKELLMLADDIMYTVKRTTKDSVGVG
jgi:diguanylate cyclase (GGDEF)-like protein